MLKQYLSRFSSGITGFVEMADSDAFTVVQAAAWQHLEIVNCPVPPHCKPHNVSDRFGKQDYPCHLSYLILIQWNVSSRTRWLRM